MAWYQTLLDTVLPEAVFTLESMQANGKSRHVRWTATTERGLAAEGEDTFGIVKGHIQFQYTRFTVAAAGVVITLV